MVTGHHRVYISQTNKANCMYLLLHVIAYYQANPKAPHNNSPLQTSNQAEKQNQKFRMSKERKSELKTKDVSTFELCFIY